MRIKHAINNRQFIDKEGPYIILSKHESYLDIFLIACAVRKNMTFVAKTSLFKIPILGWYFKNSGGIATKRVITKEELIRLKSEIAKALEDKKIVIIFPQGTRTAPSKTIEKQPYRLSLPYHFYKNGYRVVTAGLNTYYYWALEKKGIANIIFTQVPSNLDKDNFENHVTHSIESMTKKLHESEK